MKYLAPLLLVSLCVVSIPTAGCRHGAHYCDTRGPVFGGGGATLRDAQSRAGSVAHTVPMAPLPGPTEERIISDRAVSSAAPRTMPTITETQVPHEPEVAAPPAPTPSPSDIPLTPMEEPLPPGPRASSPAPAATPPAPSVESPSEATPPAPTPLPTPGSSAPNNSIPREQMLNPPPPFSASAGGYLPRVAHGPSAVVVPGSRTR